MREEAPVRRVIGRRKKRSVMTVATLQCSIKGEQVGEVCWGLSGEHNMQNGLMAIVAAHHVGVLPVDACAALNKLLTPVVV